MKSFCVSIQKGGVGKTSTCGNIAAALARMKKKVIMIDLDPQGNLTEWFCKEQPVHDIADMLYERAELASIIQPLSDNLSLLPTKRQNELRKYADNELSKAPFLIEDLLKTLDGHYEYAVIDTAPGTTQLERSILAASNFAITPINAEYFSMSGLQIFLSFRDEVQKGLRNAAEHGCVVFNNVNETIAMHRQYTKALTQFDPIFYVPQDTAIKYAQNKHVDVYGYDTKAKSVKEYKALAKWMAEK